MAFLVNRVPASRFECLHSIVKMLYSNYGVTKSFAISDVKYDPDIDNVKNYCSRLLFFGDEFSYCPYLDNPLDPKGCNLTNGKAQDADSTKSKEVSNTVNALHALGFIKRTGRVLRVTSFGKKFAEAVYGTQEMHDIIHSSVLNYGPVVGVLAQILQLCQNNKTFSSRDIYVGYPNTEEYISYSGRMIKISSGSQADSNTRTKSCIISWLTTAGYIRPLNWKELKSNEYPHYAYREQLNSGHRGEIQYVLVEALNFDSLRHITRCPLDYVNMTKLTAALRENDIADVRKVTMANEYKIQNRRFAICYYLNHAFEYNSLLSIQKLKELFLKYPNEFIVSTSNLDEVIASELDIANMTGIPFVFENKGTNLFIRPLTGLNVEEMSSATKTDIKIKIEQILSILKKEINNE